MIPSSVVCYSPISFGSNRAQQMAQPVIALLSAAAHAQSAWVKLCETQTATVENEEGGGEEDLPDALNASTTLVPQLLFPRRRHLRSRRLHREPPTKISWPASEGARLVGPFRTMARPLAQSRVGRCAAA